MSWQPMSTAPKDGTVIDLWCVTDEHSAADFYFGATMCGVVDEPQWQGRVYECWWRKNAWRPKGGLDMHPLTVSPTHWMPLPSPPETNA